MQYMTVFDVTQSGYRQWPFAAFGLIFVVVGAGLVFFRHQLRGRMHRFFPFAFLGFAVVWTLTAFVSTAGSYSRLASDLRAGRCEVTEGVVTTFHPMPYGGHQMESFVVSGRRFEYSDYVVTAGFNNTASHGGPIQQGVRVRIHHRGNDIARLEIAR
jgi:hypothetical protein